MYIPVGEYLEGLGLTFFIIGILLFVLEITQPGFFVAIPATVFIVVGLLFSAGVTSIWIFVIGAIIVAPVFMLTINFYKKIAPTQKPAPLVGESLIGRVGVVTKEIIPNTIKGKVKIENQIWSATSNVPIGKDKNVSVIASKGVHVTVKEIKNKKIGDD